MARRFGPARIFPAPLFDKPCYGRAMKTIIARRASPIRPKATLAALLLVAIGVPAFLLARAVAGGPADAAMATIAADRAGVDEGALRAAIDPLFEDGSTGTTRALVVMRDGEVVAERYAPGFSAQSRLPSGALADGVTALLVGFMVSDGRLALDMPAPVPLWSQPGDPRGAITLRQLLSMSSGIDMADGDDVSLPRRDGVRMMLTDGAQDMAAYAEGKPIAHRPGNLFAWSPLGATILSDLVTRMLTGSNDPKVRRDAMAQFLEGRLMGPVGLSSLVPEYDARGTMIGGDYMHMTARDYARLGEFLRRGGRAGGRQVISGRWIAFMRAPSRQNRAYGGMLRLNRTGGEAPLLPGAASSTLFGLSGANGQYLLVSPAQRLVVVRLGLADAGQQQPLATAVARLVDLFPTG
jgi:CubicO group peptidase (beta-lactamase class C family)